MSENTESVATHRVKRQSFFEAVKFIQQKASKRTEQAAKRKAKDEARAKAKSKARYEAKKKRKVPGRFVSSGVVHLSHIPEGFNERGLKNYFNQFGDVTRLTLCRSEKTGRSKGYAFIEFKHPEVANIAAETMNNYVMGKRLLKAQVVPSRNADKALKLTFDDKNYPGKERKIMNVKNVNRTLSVQQGQKRLANRMQNVRSMIKSLQEKGISYSFKPGEEKRNIIPLKYISKKFNEMAHIKLNQDPGEDKKKGVASSPDSCLPILVVDESDEEIVFKTPPNVIKKKLMPVSQSISSSKKNKNIVGSETKSKSKKVKKTLNSAHSEVKKVLRKEQSGAKKSAKESPLNQSKLQSKGKIEENVKITKAAKKKKPGLNIRNKK